MMMMVLRVRIHKLSEKKFFSKLSTRFTTKGGPCHYVPCPEDEDPLVKVSPVCMNNRRMIVIIAAEDVSVVVAYNSHVYFPTPYSPRER